MKDLLANETIFFPHNEVSYPIAEEIVELLVNKKISYAEARETLDVAIAGIKTLRIG